MTEAPTTITTPKATETRKPSPIPSREEFHRYASNKLSEIDFCTNYPQREGLCVAKTAQALRWSEQLNIGDRKKKNGWWF